MVFFQENFMQGAGFHSSNMTHYNASETLSGNYRQHNFLVVLSWIPVLSIIAGIYNLQIAKHLEENTNFSVTSENFQNKIYADCYRARAVASFCQATIFLMIFDLIATAGRFAPCCQPDAKVY